MARAFNLLRFLIEFELRGCQAKLAAVDAAVDESSSTVDVEHKAFLAVSTPLGALWKKWMPAHEAADQAIMAACNLSAKIPEYIEAHVKTLADIKGMLASSSAASLPSLKRFDVVDLGGRAGVRRHCRRFGGVGSFESVWELSRACEGSAGRREEFALSGLMVFVRDGWLREGFVRYVLAEVLDKCPLSGQG